jgi:GNAT superfamily N-acetyltransferase
MDDLQRVEAVVHAAYVGYVAINGQTPGPMLDDYAALIAQSRVHVLDDGDVVGVLVLLPEPVVMLLDNVAIDPSAQGKGYGRQLLAFAEGEALRAGFARVRLPTVRIGRKSGNRWTTAILPGSQISGDGYQLSPIGQRCPDEGELSMLRAPGTAGEP